VAEGEGEVTRLFEFVRSVPGRTLEQEHARLMGRRLFRDAMHAHPDELTEGPKVAR
jgi:hypothetical protein